MNDDGSDASRLIEGTSPSWSPDGTKIAFVYSTEVLDICTIRPDGSGLRPLTANWNPHAADYAPCWSADGKLIVFSSRHETEHHQVYLMDSSGQNPRRLTHSHLTYQDFSPEISPDGKTIAFARLTSQTSNIYLIDVDGSNEQLLTEGNFPSWSPDGSKILFSRKNRLLFVRNMSDSSEHELGEGNYPCWAANGQEIIFTKGEYGYEQIWIMNANGQESRQLTQNAFGNISPVWIA